MLKPFIPTDREFKIHVLPFLHLHLKLHSLFLIDNLQPGSVFLDAYV